MVTKYDVFVELYDRAKPCGIIEIVKNLKQRKSDYEKIRKILKILEKMKLAQKTAEGYQAIMNPENYRLFEALKYCMNNNVNYNELFNKSVAGCLAQAFLKHSFMAGDIGLHPRTFAKISSILDKSGFLIVLSRKPFRAMVPYNYFLGYLIAYFGYRPLIIKPQNAEYLDAIIKELTRFRKLRKRNYQCYLRILEAFQIRFIHHSLSIEGNPITMAQTLRLLRNKIVPKDLQMESVIEVQNYREVFQQMQKNVQDEILLSEEMILNYHFLAMRHRPEIAGKIRDGPVYIRGNENFSVAEVQEIELLLDTLIENSRKLLENPHRSLSEIIDFAAYLHNEFQHIHPFFDGNSRTARIITFHFLLLNDIPVFDIPLGMLEEYVKATKGAKIRDDQRVKSALQKIILYNLKTMNEKLKG